MWLKDWEDLPSCMRTDAVRPYYDILKGRKAAIAVKRPFDIVMSVVIIIVLAIPMLVIAIMIKADDGGPVFFRQKRVTTYGRDFRIFKFRTMVVDAEKVGVQVTSQGDPRITKVGGKLRRHRLDELPQIFNVFAGDMSLVGTRPEVRKYVDAYSDEMMATLLLPAGVTSEASIAYKDEDELIGNAGDPDRIYIEKVLPEKMRYNLHSVREFSLGREFMLLFKTVAAVFGGKN